LHFIKREEESGIFNIDLFSMINKFVSPFKISTSPFINEKFLKYSVEIYYNNDEDTCSWQLQSNTDNQFTFPANPQDKEQGVLEIFKKESYKAFWQELSTTDQPFNLLRTTSILLNMSIKTVLKESVSKLLTDDDLLDDTLDNSMDRQNHTNKDESLEFTNMFLNMALSIKSDKADKEECSKILAWAKYNNEFNYCSIIRHEKKFKKQLSEKEDKEDFMAAAKYQHSKQDRFLKEKIDKLEIRSLTNEAYSQRMLIASGM
ncbi:MAG: hypothetical protein GY730_07345, partial [bacterium]|nr:hypothetical protein [bacterium]